MRDQSYLPSSNTFAVYELICRILHDWKTALYEDPSIITKLNHLYLVNQQNNVPKVSGFALDRGSGYQNLVGFAAHNSNALFWFQEVSDRVDINSIYLIQTQTQWNN